MLKIFKYKSLYEDAKTKCNNLSEELSGCKKNALRKQYELERKIEEMEHNSKHLKVQLKTKELGVKQLIDKIEQKQKGLDSLMSACNKLRHDVDVKEHQRRECIGKMGGLTRVKNKQEKEIAKLESEKQAMLILINKLTEEVKHLKNNNKKIGGEK
ncbi:MAG: hypothetical protein IJ068_06645 [Bacilli bacterium]|nr:hypothetical protein [Bacilli bacterium]